MRNKEKDILVISEELNTIWDNIHDGLNFKPSQWNNDSEIFHEIESFILEEVK